MIKLSVNETKWSILLARTRALILYISIWIFDFGPEKLPGLSRNGPQASFFMAARWSGPAMIGECVLGLFGVKVCGIRFSIWESFIGFYICCYFILSRNFVGALRITTTNYRVSFIDLYLVFPRNFRMIFLPHTNTVILLEPYCGTITEPGLPVPGYGKYWNDYRSQGQCITLDIYLDTLILIYRFSQG